MHARFAHLSTRFRGSSCRCPKPLSGPRTAGERRLPATRCLGLAARSRMVVLGWALFRMPAGLASSHLIHCSREARRKKNGVQLLRPSLSLALRSGRRPHKCTIMHHPAKPDDRINILHPGFNQRGNNINYKGRFESVYRRSRDVCKSIFDQGLSTSWLLCSLKEKFARRGSNMFLLIIVLTRNPSH
jgi:hypothetical protein